MLTRHRAALLLTLIAAAPVLAPPAEAYYGEPIYPYAPPAYYAPYAPPRAPYVPPPAYYAPYAEPPPRPAPARRRPAPKPRPRRAAPPRPTPFEGPGRDATPPPPVALMPELPMARPDPDQPRRRVSPFTE